MKGIDAAAIRALASGPGVDPRLWLSYGTVSPTTPGDDPVDMSTVTDLGAPTVSVVLHPSATLVACRVIAPAAGNGEGEWEPFVEGDQVLVAIPYGDERAGCVILGRLNNLNATFPERVAGMDTKDNALAFRRTRSPFAIESAVALVFRQATTGSYISISQTGNVVLANGDNAMMQIGADVIGFRAPSQMTRIEINLEDDSIAITSLGDVNVMGLGRVFILGSGSTSTGHATTIESLLVFLETLFQLLGAANPGPLLGAPLAAAMPGLLSAAVLATPAKVLSPAYAYAIQGALTVPPTPGNPNVAAPGVLVG